MNTIIYIIIGIATGLLIAFIYSYIKKTIANKEILKANDLAKKILNDAKSEAEDLKKSEVLAAKEKWFEEQKKLEQDINERKNELRDLEKKYNQRIMSLEKRMDNLDKKENNLQNFNKKLQKKQNRLSMKENRIDEIIQKQNDKLSTIAKLSREEAIHILKNNLKNQARVRAAKEVKQIVKNTKEEANRLANGILATAIQRLSVDYVAENTVSVVSLPNNDMKGQVIGREGRNIRAFENLTGIDLIIDDTPEAVVLSGFDPVRRHIARIALEKLIQDGRIHPGRIEKIVKKTKKEIDKEITKTGEKACLDMNIHNISNNLKKIIGRLKYRTSYGQNVLKHSIECGWISGIIAAELNLDQTLARRAGFLHDIGKAVDHEYDGSHAKLGADLARKNNESKIIINAIAAHHEECEPETVYATIVQTADAISGSRPGARREIIESYMKRLEKIESLASSLEGVDKSYAIQAGRELRIFVDPAQVDENNTVYMASDVAEKIEKEVQYPGQIKVVVIRQTRQSAIAK